MNLPKIDDLMRLKSLPRFHGDGMIQLYLNNGSRLHVFHPELPPTVSNARIHDHAWDMNSTVLKGRLIHRIFGMALARGGTFDLWEARAGCGSTGGELTRCHECTVSSFGRNTFAAGSDYFFPRHVFHETRAEGLTVTLISKSHHSDLPPRILAPRGEEADNAFYHNHDVSDLWEAIREGVA